jgi:alpha-D-ribose 1-methylphosphonate 5-triphosphate synthase subunit PhnL
LSEYTIPADAMVAVLGLAKRFVLHNQGGAEIRVLRDLDLVVNRGQCVALVGPSGIGKSTILRCLYGNYLASAGSLLVRQGDGVVDLATAPPRTILDLRRHTIGYVSQFLRVIPRVPAIDIVAEPLMGLGESETSAHRRAAELLARLRIPETLWSLAPATFSGGEQQRVNIARGFIVDFPVLLLDEPTAALDDMNRQTVVDMIRERKRDGAAIVGIFHDDAVRDAVADRRYDVTTNRRAA